MLNATTAPFVVGVSLKMYFGHARTLEWAAAVAEIARHHPAVQGGLVELFVTPTFPALVPVRSILADTPVQLGAQDIAWADDGAFTGEVSGVELAEVGCTLAEVGHAERRSLFHEGDDVVAKKTAAAVRNGLTPLLCVGETAKLPPAEAALEVTRQIRAALADSSPGPVLVAYEPQWAIGAPAPASPAYIADVVSRLEAHLAPLEGRANSRVIYGGSARPGLLTALDGRVKGLFLGRFAHDPAAVALILDELLLL